MSSLKPIQLLANQPPPEFRNPAPDIYSAAMKISECGWAKTSEGVVLIDTLVSEDAARVTYDKVHETARQIKYIIYTHGHRDHVNGAPVFMADEPLEVIANHYLPARLDKYKILAQHRSRIGSQQFNLPERTITPKQAAKISFVYPTKTFEGEYTFRLGDKTFHGYFDGNPANLLPRPEHEVKSAIFDLIGDAQRVIDKARENLNNDRAQLGLQVLDVLIQAQPDNIEARKLRIELLEKVGADNYCVMSKNAWVYYIEKDREFLQSQEG